MSECASNYLTLNKFAIELCPLIKALRDTKTHFSKVIRTPCFVLTLSYVPLLERLLKRRQG